MNWRNPHLWIGAFSAAGVLYLVAKDLERTSPGPLAEVHERIPELAASSGCADCHGEGDVTLAGACIECHKDVGVHIDSGAGLHGSLEQNVVMECAMCHSDHHGVQFPMVNDRAFFIAGVPDPEAFEHDLFGFAMAGKHLELDCTKCHEHAFDEILEEGDKRFLGLSRDCVTCHEDPHEGRMARSCAECHGQDNWEELTEFDHTETLPLVGGHGGMSCQECHADDGPRSIDVMASSGPQPVWRECVDCHDSPHAGAFVEGVAQLVTMTSGSSCGACHLAEHEEFDADDVQMTPEHHAASGFPLDVPHDEVGCDECHLPEFEEFVARYPNPGRPADQCVQCHEDPHGGQFDVFLEGPFARGCIACHDAHQFEPHAFTDELHEFTALPLEGQHLEIDCNECHLVPFIDSARVFHGMDSDCDSCHSDAHRGFFDPHADELAKVPHGACAACHGADSFSDLPADGFDHGQWTGFAIGGAHVQAGCESCHPRSEEADDFGRTFGWASGHFGRVEGCVTCHADPHDGDFDGDNVPADVEGRAGCARCHDEISFRSFPGGFNHRFWTGFALDGKHGEASCATCHPPLLGMAPGERSSQRARGANCGDCHTNPHAGQFRVAGQTDCRRCHQDATSWTKLVFNHNRHSRFRLDETHAELECAACHKPWAVSDEVEVMRYRPLGRDCADCHGEGEAGLRARRKKR